MSAMMMAMCGKALDTPLSPKSTQYITVGQEQSCPFFYFFFGRIGSAFSNSSDRDTTDHTPRNESAESNASSGIILTIHELQSPLKMLMP